MERLESRRLLSRALGIDVSSFQPTIDWSQVKSSGRTFAWTKATEGVTFNDSTYSSHISGATAAGVLIGAYHYARYDNNTAPAEVSHFLSVAGNQIKAGFLRPMLDVEAPVSAGDLNTTKAQISQWVNDWCNGVYSATGVKPIVYTYVSYASTYLDSTVTQWPLWMAQYPASPNPQNGAPSGTSPWASSAWQIWQYSSTTPVLGIGGTNVSNQCDVDVFNGDSTAFSGAMVISAPIVTVTGGGGAITDGQATAVSFGSTSVGGSTPSLSFTVKNTGGSSLTLSGLSVPSGYSITTNLSSPLAAGGSESFVVRLDAASPGTKTGNISFTNNDPSRNPFNFPVTGTVTGQAPPAAPTNLTVTTYGSNSVSLSWSDNSTNETGFVILRRTGSSGSFAQVGTTDANIATFTDTGASGPAANTSYYYHVEAAIDTTLSNQSNDILLTTLAATPTNLTASDGASQNDIAVSWNAVPGVNKYAVYRSTLNDPNTSSSVGPATTNSFDDASAAPNTTYYYWVASYNSSNVAGAKSGGDSGFSDTIPPTISASSFQEEVTPPYLSFTFSEPVAALDASNLVLSNLDLPDGALPAIASAQWFSDTNTEQFYLSAPIPDGNFRATLTGAHDAAGNALAGGNAQDFYFLSGDANTDRTVNALDFNALAAHFGDSGAGLEGGDFNFDGTVDTSDFNALANHWATTLPAPLAANPLQTSGLFSDVHVPVRDLSGILGS